MPRFEVVLPEGRLLLRNPVTGETLTLTAADGPVSLGTIEWIWGGATSPTESAAEFRSEPQASAQVEPEGPVYADAATAPICRPEDWTPPENPALLTAEAEMRAILATAEAMRGREMMPAARRVLSAPLSALTQKDFEETYMALGRQSDEIEREIAYLEEIDADPEDIRELRDRLEAIDRDLGLVTERMKQFEAVHRDEEG